MTRHIVRQYCARQRVLWNRSRFILFVLVRNRSRCSITSTKIWQKTKWNEARRTHTTIVETISILFFILVLCTNCVNKTVEIISSPSTSPSSKTRCERTKKSDSIGQSEHCSVHDNTIWSMLKEFNEFYFFFSSCCLIHANLLACIDEWMLHQLSRNRNDTFIFNWK